MRWVSVLCLLATTAAFGTVPNDVPAEGDAGQICLERLEQTYGLAAAVERFGLQEEISVDRLAGCVVRDADRMPRDRMIRFCENVFKVHCDGTTALAEVAELMIADCEADIEGKLGVKLAGLESWKTCGRNRVLDDYMIRGIRIEPRVCWMSYFDACAEGAAVSQE
ncbi:hypothetical protein ABI59_16370 [Acidobacteria bacterium Mor1]|nr:hypothetical protein ABI59_16370 [Acidobacteria bacterium Mor1]